ncbi:CHASE2 domain-containing protein [Sulfurospirillum sp. 1307]
MKNTKVLFILLVVLVLNIFLFRMIEYFDYKTYDILSSFDKQQKGNTSSVVIVDIDEKSLVRLGQWPWSRVILTQLINEINSANPAGIGLDILFPERDKTSPLVLKEFYKQYFSLNLDIKGLPNSLFDNDMIFARALKNANVTLGVYLQDSNQNKSECDLSKNRIKVIDDSFVTYNSKNILCNLSEIQACANTIGFINSSVDKDGIFRRVPLFIKYFDNVVPTLGLATLSSLENIKLDKDNIDYLGNSLKIGPNSEVLLKFYDKSWYKRISAVDIFTADVDKKMLSGKFILIGTSAVGLHDRFIATGGRKIAGIEVHSTLIDNIILNDFRHEIKNLKLFNFILANIFLILLFYLLYKKRYISFLSTFLSILVIFSFISYMYIVKNVYISSAYFLAPFVIGFALMNLFSIIMSYVERKIFDKEIMKAHSSVLDSMSLVAESRDAETGAHIKRTKEYSKLLASYLKDQGIYTEIINDEFIELIYRASPLHDIGKVGIPDNVLKKPGKLTYEEFEIMKEHPVIGKKILDNALIEQKDNKFLKIAKNIAYYHHEKWDGSGYPLGLKKEQIPLEARIMALSDVYDALISRRIYKKAFDYGETEEIIIKGKGTHFDPLLVDAFFQIKDRFKQIADRIKEE